ncbi:MAG TPA: hypothetical protein VEX15_16100 [Nocardioidaceae bacterium]|nr:hypothetical protein [Nocardioidaceae bacterium]
MSTNGSSQAADAAAVCELEAPRRVASSIEPAPAAIKWSSATTAATDPTKAWGR